MGIPTGAPHALVIVGGSLVGSEVWSCGHWRLFETGTATPTPGEINTYASDILSAAQSHFWALASGAEGARRLAHSTTTLAECTVRYYESGVNTRTGHATATPAAGTGTAPHSNQSAAVVTLRTDLPGKRHRGRMYLPCTGATLTTGQLTSAVVTDVLNAIKAWFGLSAFGPGWDPGRSQAPVVVSHVASSSEPVSQLRMDTRLDSLRGRAKSQVALADVSIDFP